MEKAFKVIEGRAETVEEELNDLLDEWDEVKVCGSRFYIDRFNYLWVSVLVYMERKENIYRNSVYKRIQRLQKWLKERGIEVENFKIKSDFCIVISKENLEEFKENLERF